MHIRHIKNLWLFKGLTYVLSVTGACPRMILSGVVNLNRLLKKSMSSNIVILSAAKNLAFPVI
jgi:hypothetical protein